MMVGHRGEAGEDVPEVGVGIKAAAAAALDDGVEDGAAVAGGVGTDEEPVFLAQGGGPDGVLDEVVVDFDPAVVEIHGEGGPLPKGVAAGLAQRTLGQHPGLHPDEDAVEAFNDHPAVAGADGGAEVRSGPQFPHPGFDLVKVLDLAEEPAAQFR